MIGLIQRVASASVTVDEQIVGAIGSGLLALVAVEPGDSEQSAETLVERIMAYRVFDDDEGRMNLSLRDVRGELLLVSQFTLAADTRKGLRPGFSTAADPATAERVFLHGVAHAQRAWPGRVATGRFGAHMRVALVNDGPVTFWLRFSPSVATEPT
jgi:D-tyrosyl-tRNA(Tyr) deacylase